MRDPMNGEGRPAGTGGEAGAEHDREVPEVDLLAPLVLREVTLRNRIGMSPMCQYSCRDGFAHDWHLVHLGSRAAGGAGLVMAEATAILPEGRITPGDLGLWSDEHIEPLARIAAFITGQGAVPGIQLAHAGRKASCAVPWLGGQALSPAEGGWTVSAPSATPFSETSPVPAALDSAGIGRIIVAFEQAARRALVAGFRLIEIHAAHGYLLHEFLSPLSNRRSDEYGGTLDNRMRLVLHVAERLRLVVPQELPLAVRISATDWVEGGWDIEQSIVLCRALRERGVDLVDVSSGGLVPKASIPVARGFQVPLARRIRLEAGIATAAVGMITEIGQANDIITEGDADLVLLGRELLRNPYWPHQACHTLGGEPDWPVQYGYAVRRRR